jgi:hypothetical protein
MLSALVYKEILFFFQLDGTVSMQHMMWDGISGGIAD